MRLDMHVHTYLSPDCILTPDVIIKTCLKKNINGIAATDHNTIKGAVELKSLAPFLVIIGEEIKTARGEVIGYFLEEEIQAGIDIEETISRIKRQGGIVCIPHPFDKIRKSRVSPSVIDKVLNQIDLIEVYNSRNLLTSSNRIANEYAKRHKKLPCVGSDAHLKCEIGGAYIEIDHFDNPKQFLQNLASAKFITNRSGLWVHLVTKFIKFTKKNGPLIAH